MSKNAVLRNSVCFAHFAIASLLAEYILKAKQIVAG